MRIEELSPENVLQKLENRQVELKNLLRAKQRKLSRAPEGSLRTSISHNTQQFYLADTTKKRHYIKKHNVELVKTLAQKEYDKKIITQIDNEIKSLNMLICQLKNSGISSVYSNIHLAKKNFIQPVTLSNEEYEQKWRSVKFKAKDFKPGSVLIPTSMGFPVRSKSELLIVDCLVKEKIPFRYEYPVKLNNLTVYPDFYCLNLRTRKEIIWEHFGLMDNLEYSSATSKKINAYIENNLFLGDKLIFTMETLEMPLDQNLVLKLIRRYLT